MASRRICCLLVVLLCFTVDIICQVCENISQYGSCSTDSNCGCLHFPYADHIGVCALMGLSCSELDPCEASDSFCQEPNSICIRHPQCDSRPLCYPLALTSQEICPPIPAINTTRPIIFISNYSGVLTSSNERLPKRNSYYQVFEFIVNATGAYYFSSLSNIDTYGCLYRGKFNTSDSFLSRGVCDHSNGDNGQFKFLASLEAGVLYTLLFTTFSRNITGPFSIVASGPNYVNFIPTILLPITTIPTSTRPSIVISNYTGVISPNNRMPGSKYTYYHAVQFTINTAGTYEFLSSTSIHTYGCLYRGKFSPSDPNLIRGICGYEHGGSREFKFRTFLDAGVLYTLQFKRYAEEITGNLSVVASGPDYIDFIPTTGTT